MRGSATTRMAAPSQRNAVRHPSAPTSAAMTGTRTNCPAAEPAATTPRASPRRAVNQRATATAEVELDAPPMANMIKTPKRSEEHTSELQSLRHLVCRLLLE